MSDDTLPGSPDVPDPGTRPEGLVGTVLAGRYKLVRLLGSGAMGAVYVGEHLKIGRQDAIKVLKTALARDPEAVARFTRGARNASAIRHPNVCTVYDFSDTSDGLQFLAMEFVDGESLTDLLEREGPLSVERAVRMTVQAASALEAAHELGIVHRDLKPDNIMVARQRDGSDLVKVVDFDIAKGSAEGEAKGVTRLGFVVGTPEYMSPEQLTGDPLDGRSDIFSLGLVFFRMITGTLPYTSASTQDIMVDRLTKDPLKLGDMAPGTAFPPALQEVLDHALARNREDRCATARDFALELWEAVFGPAGTSADGDAGTASLPGTVIVSRQEAKAAAGPTEREQATRRRWIQGGAAVATLAIVVTVVATLLSSGPPEAASVMVPPALTLGVGDTTRVAATVLDPDGAPLEARDLQWSSSQPAIAAVSAAGTIRGVGVGTASIRVAAGDANGVINVTVSSPEAASAEAPRLGRRSLAFRASVGGSSPPAQSVDVSGAPGAGEALVSSVGYAPGGAAGWLSARLRDAQPPTTLDLQTDRLPTSPGRYDANVVVGWEGAAAADTLRVTLDVEARSTPAPTPVPARLTAEDANTRAWNQLFLLTDDPSAGARRAVKDTTEALWNATYLPDSIRARAAYAHAQAAVELHEMSEGLEWARRASTLVPGDTTYRDYLRQLQGGGGP
ncbi:MAG: protein kinase [Gemmatimonadota bacterium]|jgi:predicted Ser/Thr protein kinase